MTDADRKRRQRERERSGQRIYAVTVNDVEVTEMLVGHGLLAPWQTDCSSSVGAALSRYVNDVSRVTSGQAI